MTNTQTVAVPTVGEELTPFTRETGFANWNRYAAVNDEFVPIHMDDEAGRIAGQSGAFGMGNLQWSYLHNLVRQWAGDDAVILSMSCQFRKPNTKGTVTVYGRVTSVDSTEEGTEVGLELWTEDAVGDKMAPGAARVLLR